MDLLQYAVLGIGASAIYALAGHGVVAIYQGSGVLNFAHGAIALVAAWCHVRMTVDWGWPLPLAMAVAVILAAGGGGLISLLVMRPLRTAAPLVRVAATLGALAALQQLVILMFGTDLRLVPSSLPQGSWMLGSVRVDHDRLILLVVAVGVTLLLTLLYRHTQFGYVTRAAAENRRAVGTLGYSPDAVGALNWALGGALAAVAGILTVPISGLNLEGLVLLVVPAFAAALVGGFSSFPLTLVGALGLGMGQSVLSRYVTVPGVQEALPLLVIVAVLVLRGSAIPRRDEETLRLPRVGRSGLRPGVAVVLGAGLIASVWVASDGLVGPLTTTVLVATIGLSLVVVTGFAGQVSLGQFALAGIGAFAAARASFSWLLPFPAAWVVGVLAAIVVGLVFAIPSLRTRGVSLAVVTMALALAVEKVVFGNHDLIRGQAGTPVETPRILGWTIDPLLEPRRYGTVAAVVFVLACVVTLNARSGGVGRRLLAVRSNERAAAALGIGVARVKFFAFGLAAAIAAAGGVVVGFRGATVRYEPFDVTASLNAVVYALLGGVGYVAGAAIGALMAPATLVSYLLSGHWDLDHLLALVGGVLLIVTLIVNPDGIASAAQALVRRPHGTRPQALSARRRTAPPMEAPERVPPCTLAVEGITVTFGNVHAVDGASLVLRPGQITGLIGANGAGKSTLIDAISGFVPLREGRVELDGTRVEGWSTHRRAKAGIGRTFQSLELFDDLTVAENVLTATDRLRWSDWLVGLAAPSANGLGPEASHVIARLGLDPWLDHDPSALSFGQRRLLSVARAVACRPSVLLVDEPAAGLNDTETEELGTVLRWLADEWGMALLLVEHDVALVSSISDEILVLDFGQVIFTGPPEAALADPAVRAAYLGSDTVEEPA